MCSTFCREARRRAFAGGLAGLLSVAAAAEDRSDVSWRRVDPPRGVGREALTVVVRDPNAAPDVSRWALGGPDGVSFYAARGQGGDGRADPSPRRIASVGAVRDLAFDAGGGLWIAGARWLYRVEFGGARPSPVRFPLGSGERANRVHRIAARGPFVVGATEAGVFLRRGAGAFGRLSSQLPLARAGALALGSRAAADGHLELEVVIGGAVWRVDDATDGALEIERLPPLAGLSVAALPVQILLDVPGYDAIRVYPRALALRREGAEHFEIVRPPAAPGARFAWLAVGKDRSWLASDGGLLEAASPRGPWRRAAEPAGGHPVARVALGAKRVMAATALGLLEGARTPAASPSASSSSGDPEIRAVQRRVLRYLGLGPERFRRLRRGVDRRGLWPDVELRFGAFLGQQSGSDFDESFSYGELHRLSDSEKQRDRDLDVALLLRWELGDWSFDPRAIDLSRELRQRIALRDDVLDQVNQLYFERQAALDTLLAGPAKDDERRRLQRRADELAAGLDGWTGGWFGARPAQPRRDASQSGSAWIPIESTENQ